MAASTLDGFVPIHLDWPDNVATRLTLEGKAALDYNRALD